MKTHSFGIQIGTIKWYNKEKGFGFIKPNDGSEELFVHCSKIIGNENGNMDFDNGQKVEYTIGQNLKGLQAENVTLPEQKKKNNHNKKRVYNKSFTSHNYNDSDHEIDERINGNNLYSNVSAPIQRFQTKYIY